MDKEKFIAACTPIVVPSSRRADIRVAAVWFTGFQFEGPFPQGRMRSRTTARFPKLLRMMDLNKGNPM